MSREREEWMSVNTEPEGKGNIRDNGMEVLGKVLAPASPGYRWLGTCHLALDPEGKGLH